MGSLGGLAKNPPRFRLAQGPFSPIFDCRSGLAEEDRFRPGKHPHTPGQPACLLDPALERSRLICQPNPRRLFLCVLLKFLHGLLLVVFPIAYLFPPFLERLPYPEAFERSEFCVGEHV